MAKELVGMGKSMSLMKKVTELCASRPHGISPAELHAFCPEVERYQITAAVRNCLTRKKIRRVNPGGTVPLYGPQQEPKQAEPVDSRFPLNTRKPISSVWDLAA